MPANCKPVFYCIDRSFAFFSLTLIYVTLFHIAFLCGLEAFEPLLHHKLLPFGGVVCRWCRILTIRNCTPGGQTEGYSWRGGGGSDIFWSGWKNLIGFVGLMTPRHMPKKKHRMEHDWGEKKILLLIRIRASEITFNFFVFLLQCNARSKIAQNMSTWPKMQ